MAKKDVPSGKLYRDLYIERGAPTKDSERMRSRLRAFYEHRLTDHEDEIALEMHLRTGKEIDLIHGAYHAYFDFAGFFRDADLIDVLHSITIIWQVVSRSHRESAANWRAFADQVMVEENVGYRVDNQGSVHPRVDDEFERNMASAIAALQPGRYGAARREFEKARDAAGSVPPDWNTAIWLTFVSAEIVFKLICDAQRLEAAEVERRLKPRVRELYAGNEPAIDAANQLLNALGKWVSAAHQYRHGPKAEEPVPPPDDLAITLISGGATWVRWLAQIDQKLLTKKGRPTTGEAV